MKINWCVCVRAFATVRTPRNKWNHRMEIEKFSLFCSLWFLSLLRNNERWWSTFALNKSISINLKPSFSKTWERPMRKRPKQRIGTNANFKSVIYTLELVSFVCLFFTLSLLIFRKVGVCKCVYFSTPYWRLVCVYVCVFLKLLTTFVHRSSFIFQQANFAFCLHLSFKIMMKMWISFFLHPFPFAS